MHEQDGKDFSAFHADKIHLSSIRTFSRFKFVSNSAESRIDSPKLTDETAVQTGLNESVEMKRTLGNVTDCLSRHQNETHISVPGTESTAEDEPLDSFSEGSSDGYSVDSDGNLKNDDQTRGERLLPLKRLKKGFSSSRREISISKPSDWTEHITPYDPVISVAFDHANYTRHPPNFVDARQLRQRQAIEEAADKSAITAVQTTQQNMIQSSVDTPVLLLTAETNKADCVLISTNICVKMSSESSLDEKPMFTSTETLRDDVNEAQEVLSLEKNVQERQTFGNDARKDVTQIKSAPDLAQKMEFSPNSTVDEQSMDVGEPKKNENLAHEVIKEPKKTDVDIEDVKQKNKTVNFTHETQNVETLERAENVSVVTKELEKLTEIKDENDIEMMDSTSETEDAINDSVSSTVQLRKARGRPKGRKNFELPMRRSYRSVFGRLRIRSKITDAKPTRETVIKRPVGRPRKYPPVENKIQQVSLKKSTAVSTSSPVVSIVRLSPVSKSVNEENKLKLSSSTVAINVGKKFVKENQTQDKMIKVKTTPKSAVETPKSISLLKPLTLEVLEPDRESLWRKDEHLGVEKVDTKVKDRLLSISADFSKRPKGRPRIYPITMQINKEMGQFGKKRKNKAPNFQRTLLQSLSERSKNCEENQLSDMNRATGIGLDKTESSNSSKDDKSKSPSPIPAAASSNSGNGTGTSDTSVAPSNWFSQISKRSSLRQVECAFRFREIVVKRYECFIHIVLTSNTRVKNGLNCQVLHELRTALLSAKNDNRCNCVMLSGTGGVFCSGVDLISLSNDKTKATAEKLSIAIRDFCKSLMTFTKPLVAAVNGAAVGLGVSMLPYFDLVYATDKATFYSPYAKLGQCPEAGSTFLLPTVMGYARANGLLLEGRKLTATEAYDCGIVTQVLWPATFMEEVMPRVQALASRPSQALESTKALVRFHALNKLEVTLDTECRLLHQYWSSDECRQAIKHFLENEEIV